MQEKILVMVDFTKEQKSILQQAAPNAVFEYVLPKEVTRDMVHAADMIVGNPKPEFLKGAHRLKLLQLQSAGTNQYSRETIPEGCIFACATGTYGLAISEYMLACVMQMFNHLEKYHDNQKTGAWKRMGYAKSVYGSTALIVGLGDIGGEFAKRVKALGGYTIGVRRTDLTRPEYRGTGRTDSTCGYTCIEFAGNRANLSNHQCAQAFPDERGCSSCQCGTRDGH